MHVSTEFIYRFYKIMLNCLMDQYVCAKLICFCVDYSLRKKNSWVFCSEGYYRKSHFLEHLFWGAMGKLRARLLTKVIVPLILLPFPQLNIPLGGRKKKGIAPFLPMPREPQTTDITWKSVWGLKYLRVLEVVIPGLDS